MKLFKRLIVLVITVLLAFSGFSCTNPTNNSSLDGEHVCEFVITESKQATCTEDGWQVIGCTYCGKVYETKVIPASGHDFGEWYQTKPATCKEEGEEYKDCKNCSFFDTRMIQVTDHDYSYNVQIYEEATCFKKGKAIGYCLCGKTEEIVLEMVDHNYENGECTMCGAKEE